MKYKYLAIACLLGIGGLSFTSCTDEFSKINSSEADINDPDIRYLFTQCLYEFEPMDYTAWFYDIPRMSTWMQCTVGQMEANTSGVNGNSSGFNLITEQGSIGYAVMMCCDMLTISVIIFLKCQRKKRRVMSI